MFVFKRYLRILVVLLLLCLSLFILYNFILSDKPEKKPDASYDILIDDWSYYNLASMTASYAQLPPQMTARLLEGIAESGDFIQDLYSILEGDPYLRILVDKKTPLSLDYEPQDLVDLRSGSYDMVSGHMLRSAAAEGLEEMAAAAREEGLTKIVLSAFRSYFYQSRVYTDYVMTMGQPEADKISARPGHSQHQLGVTVDFNALDNELAQTPEGIWLAANASRFGWSLSYPCGYEEATGYNWESWHYRYVGKELSAFIDKYFDGIQQYALLFIHEWENLTSSRIK